MHNNISIIRRRNMQIINDAESTSGVNNDITIYISTHLDTVERLAYSQTCSAIYKLVNRGMPKVHRLDMIALDVATFDHLYSWLDSCEVVNPIMICSTAAKDVKYNVISGVLDTSIYKLSEIFCMSRYRQMTENHMNANIFTGANNSQPLNYDNISLTSAWITWYNQTAYCTKDDQHVFHFALKYYISDEYETYIDVFWGSNSTETFDIVTDNYLSTTPGILDCNDEIHTHSLGCISPNYRGQYFINRLFEKCIELGNGKLLAHMISTLAADRFRRAGNSIHNWFTSTILADRM